MTRRSNNLLTVGEFAEKSGFSKSYIYNAIRVGALAHEKVKKGLLGEVIKIPSSELDKVTGNTKG